ncbi:MAG: tetratricopeptide repeat protein [Elusimicrobiota bacterium]
MKIFKKLISVFFLLFFFAGFSFAQSPHYTRGVNYYLDGRMEDALEALERAYKENPEDKRTKALMGEILVIKAGKAFEEDSFEEAFEHIKTARELAPESKEIEKVFLMLDEKLHPEKYDVSGDEVSENAFSDIKKEQEEKREERVRIIESPPEKITQKEKELLRPIFIDSQEEKSSPLVYYVIFASLFVVLIVLFITFLWIKHFNAVNARVIEKITESSRQSIEKSEAELMKLRRKEEKRRQENKKEAQSRARRQRLKEEKLKAEYGRLVAQARATGGSPRKIAESRITTDEKEEKKRIELLRAFNGLKNKNPSGAVALLKKMAVNPNSWVRLWSAELAGSLDAENGRKALTPLLSDREMAVKKQALKTLRAFLDNKNTPLKQKRIIREIVDKERSQGWVV